jgi:hypothetical protein
MPLYTRNGKLLTLNGKLRGCCCTPTECLCCSTEPPASAAIEFPGGTPNVPIYQFYSDGNWDDVIAGLSPTKCWYGSDLFEYECINGEETVSHISFLLVLDCETEEGDTILTIYVREFLEGETEYTNYGYYRDSRTFSAPMDCEDYFSTIFPLNTYDFVDNLEGELCISLDYTQLYVVPS